MSNFNISEQDFIKMERASPFKNEYYRGQIVSMQRSSYNHSMIVSNLLRNIHTKLKLSGYSVFFNDLRVNASEVGFYTYPDILIIDDKPRFSDEECDTITNPKIIIEVASDSTLNYDKSVKFGLYRFINEFQEYILVHENKPFVEYFFKMGELHWLEGEAKGLEKSFKIKSLEMDIKLKDIYEGLID